MREIEVNLMHLVPNRRAFNPSIIEFRDKTFLFYRYEKIDSYNTEIAVIQLDEKYRPIDRTNTRIDLRKFPAGVTTFDDPRAFIYKGAIHFVYARGLQIHTRQGKMWVSGIGIAHVNDGKLVRQFLPFFGNNKNISNGWAGQKSEKNWSPFEYDGKVLMVYSINPLVVIESDLNRPQCRKVSETSFDQSFWKWGKFLGGGTPMLKRGEEYYGFFHSFVSDGTNKPTCRRYNMGFYSIVNDKGFWKVKRISTKPLLEAEKDAKRDLRKSDDWWLPNCVYPCGMIERGDKVIISAGWQDCRCMLYEYDWDEILEDVKTLEHEELVCH